MSITQDSKLLYVYSYNSTLNIDDKYVTYVVWIVSGVVPIIRIFANNGTIDIIKSFTGMSIWNNSSTFSNSLYTYLQWWSSNTMLLFKLNSADLSVADSYQYVFPINYSDLRSFWDKLKLSDSSGEILITIGNDQNISSFNFMLLKHDFNSISNPLAKKEIDPGSLPIGKSSRFKRYFDYDNSKGYLIWAFSSKLLFFTIDLDTISLQKGFYYFK